MRKIKPLQMMEPDEFMRWMSEPDVPSEASIARLAVWIDSMDKITVSLTEDEFAVLLTLVKPERAEELRQIVAERE
jgi:hypothetical protein